MKKVFCLIALLIFLIGFACAEPFRVYDSADLFTDQEEQQIENRILEFRKENKIDFAVLTTDDFIAKDQQAYIAGLFYDSLDIGIGKDKDGAVFYIDMDKMLGFILPEGNFLINDVMLQVEDVKYITGECNPYFSEQQFAQGVLQGIDLLQTMIDEYWEKQLN